MPERDMAALLDYIEATKRAEDGGGMLSDGDDDDAD
jgi:hypothetical protein